MSQQLSKNNNHSTMLGALEAQYADVQLSPDVKGRIDRTIERYSLAKSLLELHTLAVPLCLPKKKDPAEGADL